MMSMERPEGAGEVGGDMLAGLADHMEVTRVFTVGEAQMSTKPPWLWCDWSVKPERKL